MGPTTLSTITSRPARGRVAGPILIAALREGIKLAISGRIPSQGALGEVGRMARQALRDRDDAFDAVARGAARLVRDAGPDLQRHAGVLAGPMAQASRDAVVAVGGRDRDVSRKLLCVAVLLLAAVVIWARR